MYLSLMKKIHNPHSLDSFESYAHYKEVIGNNKFLKKLYTEWYREITSTSLPAGKIVEIGSGAGFIKDIFPQVITTDIQKLPYNDMAFDALQMPFEDSSISCLFFLNAFHHISNSEKLLHEASRVLQLGGKIIMIEPHNSFWGRLIYQNLHHEPFLPDGTWELPPGGPLSSANGALPWIVFRRDYEIFQKKYKNLKLVSYQPQTPLRYLFSGGLFYRAFLPESAFDWTSILDKKLVQISKGAFSMFAKIIIEKI